MSVITIGGRPHAAAPRLPRWDLQVYGVAAGAMALAFGVVAALVVALTHGRFGYTLDDAYIHLSMAEQILRGGYGVNPGEAASASSSLLFPYLDAAFLRLGLGAAAPLAVEVPSLLACLAAIQALARAGGLIRAGDRPVTAGLMVAFIALVLNLVGLALTGMEHELQVALTLAALLGVWRLGEGRPAPWLVPVLVLSPLVRFEGAAVLVSGAGALMLAGRRRSAVIALALGAALVFAFLWRLHALGLPWLPSSVLAKAASGQSDGALRLTANLDLPAGALLAAFAVVPVISELTGRSAPLDARARLAAFAAPVLFAHLLLGPMGWMHRYEAYALALGAMTAVALYGGWLRDRVAARGPVAIAAALYLCVLLAAPYLSCTLAAPVAARSIQLQQAQMHRLAVDGVRGPVAVNDLGQVSWRNDAYVLDLWGLGSETARRARAAGRDPAWMDVLARRHGVRLAMIYDDAFPRLPPRWTKIGELNARVPLTVEPTVSFYAVDPRDAGALRAVLARWARDLPAEDRFDADRIQRTLAGAKT